MSSHSPKLSTSLPLISVIIPIYNVARFLEHCISSVLAQTYQNLEIILVNDGSTDSSGNLCDVFAKKDPRIKVIHQKNRGLSGARNIALELATGDFLIFVDSDDSIRPDLIFRLYSLCCSQHAEISICGFSEQSFDNPTPLPPQSTQTMSPLAALTTMLCETDFSMSACGKLYARSLFKSDPFAPVKPTPIRFPEGMLHEDVGTTYKLVLNSKIVAFTPEKLYNYHQNPSSITKQSFSSRKLDLITLTDEMCDHIEAWAREQSPDIQFRVKNLAKKRRAHARFSILRQMVLIDPNSLPHPSPQKISPKNAAPDTSKPQNSLEDRAFFLKTRREIIKYLRQHKSDILRNPLASRRDQLAMLSLLLGLPFFKRAWLTYQAHKSK